MPSLSLGFSDVFFVIRPGFGDAGRISTKVRCHFHHIILKGAYHQHDLTLGTLTDHLAMLALARLFLAKLLSFPFHTLFLGSKSSPHSRGEGK